MTTKRNGEVSFPALNWLLLLESTAAWSDRGWTVAVCPLLVSAAAGSDHGWAVAIGLLLVRSTSGPNRGRAISVCFLLGRFGLTGGGDEADDRQHRQTRTERFPHGLHNAIPVWDRARLLVP